MSEPARSVESGPPAFRSNFPVFRMMFGNVVSFFGDQVYLLALPLVVLTLTQSPLSMGIVAALERLPILLQPAMGLLADYCHRKRLLLYCDFGRFLILGGVALLFLSDRLLLSEVYGAALVIGVLSQIYNTAQFASIPQLVQKNDLQLVNAVNSGLFNTAVFIAPGLGGLLISLYNPGYALLVNSLSFLVAFVTVVAVPIHPPDTIDRPKRWAKDIKEGFQHVYRNKPILFTNTAMLVSIFGTTLFLTMMIFHLKGTIYLSTVKIGWLLSIGGVAAIFGAMASNFLKKRFSYRQILFPASLLGGCSIVLFSIVQNYWLLVAGNALGTFAASVQSPCIVTIRQMLTPDFLLGRVQATSRFMTWGTMPVAAFMAGVISDSASTSVTIGIGGVLVIGASLIYLHPSLHNGLSE